MERLLSTAGPERELAPGPGPAVVLEPGLATRRVGLAVELAVELAAGPELEFELVAKHAALLYIFGEGDSGQLVVVPLQAGVQLTRVEAEEAACCAVAREEELFEDVSQQPSEVGQ